MVEVIIATVGKSMNRDTAYSKYHPNAYRDRTPIFWWVGRWIHVRFIARELTSVFVALFAVELLLFVRALSSGPEAYGSFLTWLQTSLSLVLHFIGLLFVLFHSITWFNLAPRAMVIRVGKIRIPDALIVAGNFFGWIAVSALLVWVILR